MQKNQPATTTLQTRDPFQTLLGRLFGDTLQDFYGSNEPQAQPRINVSESDQSYDLSFELPGLEEKDIHVQLQDHMLTVSGERKENRETQGKRWHRVEHRYGQFSRTIALPNDAAGSGVQAVYRQGVLTVTVPKVPESRPTKIEVRAN